MSTETDTRVAQLEKEINKLNRRKRRAVRQAKAEGMMQGIIGMLKPGDVVFDCGANVGAVADPLSQTGATVHAFEPDPWAFEQLTARLQGRDNVVLHNAAVGATAGTVELMRAPTFEDDPKKASVMSTIIAGGRNMGTEAGDKIEVPLLCLPDLIDEEVAKSGEIAFLKIDIEGAELDLINAMADRNQFGNVRVTVAETHESKFKELKPAFAALRTRIGSEYPASKVYLDWI